VFERKAFGFEFLKHGFIAGVLLFFVLHGKAVKRELPESDTANALTPPSADRSCSHALPCDAVTCCHADGRLSTTVNEFVDYVISPMF